MLGRRLHVAEFRCSPADLSDFGTDDVWNPHINGLLNMGLDALRLACFD
jgi:hypothetical protein